MDSFVLNRKIAYKGQIGSQRERFCIDYITKKQKIFSELLKKQNEIALSKSETITCKKGCPNCCVLFVGASLQEGEVIVYYLYQNEDLLNHFIERYPLWRAKVEEAGDIFKKSQENQDNPSTTNISQAQFKRDNSGDLTKYARQEIYCPFLRDGICSIYEVRPFLCAGLIVTTPNQWCSPLCPDYNKKKTYQTFSPDLYNDISFYYRELREPVYSFMPIMVYKLLKNGISEMLKIPGLENLFYHYMNDSEVITVINKSVVSP
ncbi:hypothetical protein ACFLUX_00985 [Chloroflexota bacterium]